METNKEKHYTIKELSEKLLVSKPTIKRFIERGELKSHVWLNGYTIIYESDLSAFLTAKNIKL